jgi:molybdopterin/thiamine biosynthesis adenylyltransferase
LRKKTIGIAGLSVGRSVALTIANERIAGALVLADFDKIELTNLNRLKVSLSDLGLNKSVSAAREISELDPYLQVYCLHEGLKIANFDSFFHSPLGTIDLFIEECDDLEIKIKSRLKSRELGIPVVMEASDRCLVDIERYDLEPQYPILHGIIDEEEIENVSSLKTFEEKLALMSKIVDVNNISERMKSSLPEIGKTLRTWPQLASDVTYGAGVVALICRLILLGEIINSSRNYVDASFKFTSNQK